LIFIHPEFDRNYNDLQILDIEFSNYEFFKLTVEHHSPCFRKQPIWHAAFFFISRFLSFLLP